MKIIETATTLEFYEYNKNPIVSSVNKETKENKELKIEENKKTKDLDLYSSLRRKIKHYEAMRWEIARIVDTNFDNQTKFLTLTFKDNITDIEYTNNEFMLFIKRLNYFLYKTKTTKLKYIAVWEKQKRGCIHYHVILFSLPYIKKEKLQELWGHGFIKINKIDVDSADNRGRYVSKYFSKDLDEKEYKKKAFFKSQNLKMPKVTKMLVTEDMDFTGQNIVYSKTYTRKIPNQPYNKTMGDIKDYEFFTESEVKYTKIRKDNTYDYDKQK